MPHRTSFITQGGNQRLKGSRVSNLAQRFGGATPHIRIFITHGG